MEQRQRERAIRGRERARRPTSLSNVEAGGDAWRKHTTTGPIATERGTPTLPHGGTGGPGRQRNARASRGPRDAELPTEAAGVREGPLGD